MRRIAQVDERRRAVEAMEAAAREAEERWKEAEDRKRIQLEDKVREKEAS